MNRQERASMAVHQNAQKSLFDDLYCEEEKWAEIEAEEGESEIVFNKNDDFNLSQDLFWVDYDEELQSLSRREKETCLGPDDVLETRFSSRKQAVEWILRIKGHHGFSASTAILAVNYLDRFRSRVLFQEDKPWMLQLAAVACLSLAAKVEETHVPLLVDLQVEDAEYVFEAKTIQRMELLVLSSLKWRMNPITPVSFIDYIIRRLECKSWEFLRSCENVLLSVISESRFLRYLPSVLATATMVHVIHQVEPCNAIDFENKLLGVLKISKEEVDRCYEHISDKLSLTGGSSDQTNPRKRKICHAPSSPNRVVDAFFSCDSSNESWGVASLSSSSCIISSSSSTSPSPRKPGFKSNK